MAQHEHFLNWGCDLCGGKTTTYLSTSENVARLAALLEAESTILCRSCQTGAATLKKWGVCEQEPVNSLPEKSASTGSVPVATGWSAPLPVHQPPSFKRSVPVKKTALSSVDHE